MRDRILIEKDLLPYSFDILLGAESYNLEVKYNNTAELFTVTLSKDDEVLVYDEPLIYGVEMFAVVYQSGVYPAIALEPYDESEQEIAVTWDNLNSTVFLTVKQGGDETDGQ